MATSVPAYLIAGVAFVCAGVLAAGPIVAPITGTWRAAAAPGNDDAAPHGVDDGRADAPVAPPRATAPSPSPSSTGSRTTAEDALRDAQEQLQSQLSSRTALGVQAQAIGDAMWDLEVAGP